VGIDRSVQWHKTHCISGQREEAQNKNKTSSVLVCVKMETENRHQQTESLENLDKESSKD
jgi:hypothetical protein